MGTYIYKVASTAVGHVAGVPVFEATYAYKLYLGGDGAENRKNAFRSGALACEAAWRRKPEAETHTVFVRHADRLFPIRRCRGTIVDDAGPGVGFDGPSIDATRIEPLAGTRDAKYAAMLTTLSDDEVRRHYEDRYDTDGLPLTEANRRHAALVDAEIVRRAGLPVEGA